ncbi:hypothetical protein [Embleya sp. AB8]|uniref:hypothetical protein n=1 Tax=Embleya sp. AB8 TaxID=3156304 RepID=UPI003C785264
MRRSFAQPFAAGKSTTTRAGWAVGMVMGVAISMVAGCTAESGQKKATSSGVCWDLIDGATFPVHPTPDKREAKPPVALRRDLPICNASLAKPPIPAVELRLDWTFAALSPDDVRQFPTDPVRYFSGGSVSRRDSGVRAWAYPAPCPEITTPEGLDGHPLRLRIEVTAISKNPGVDQEQWTADAAVTAANRAYAQNHCSAPPLASPAVLR